MTLSRSWVTTPSYIYNMLFMIYCLFIKDNIKYGKIKTNKKERKLSKIYF